MRSTAAPSRRPVRGAGIQARIRWRTDVRGRQRIRAHAASLPESAWVLETDAPYIAPSWRRKPDSVERTEPADLARIADELAALRGVDCQDLARANQRNAVAALPRLGALLAVGLADATRAARRLRARRLRAAGTTAAARRNTSGRIGCCRDRDGHMWSASALAARNRGRGHEPGGVPAGFLLRRVARAAAAGR